jgi:dihydrofolate synthase/folylpolyglutamate synthase
MYKFKKYYDAISFLEGLSNIPLKGDYLIDTQNPDLYLKRMRYFLNLLGNPDKKLKFIHITGTAGKGSVTNMLHEVLLASGKNVGSFTSPFVTTSIEKIKVKDKYISPDELADIVDYLKPFIDLAYLKGPYGRPSYFEIFLVIALVYFKKKKCGVVVMEVGLGGRYDATNIIQKPLVTAITNIDYDHTEVLGKTLKKIACDKAGIIKKGSVFFTGERRPQLIKLFSKICEAKKVPLNQVKSERDYKKSNEALVTEIAKYLKVDEKFINSGIKNSRLPCRFEIMQHNPLIVLDGAHNRVKVMSAITNLQRIKYGRLIVILAMADNKDHDSMLNEIIPLANHLVITRFQIKDRKCAHPKEILLKSKKYLKANTPTEVFLDCNLALNRAIKIAKKDDVVIAIGSFFLSGELRKNWFPEDYILENRMI